MVERFRNMHGHRLKVVFYREPTNLLTLAALGKKQTLGADPGIKLIQRDSRIVSQCSFCCLRVYSLRNLRFRKWDGDWSSEQT